MRLAYAHHALAASSMRDERLSATAYVYSDAEDAESEDGAENDEADVTDDTPSEIATPSSIVVPSTSSGLSSLIATPWAIDYSRRQSSI
jgi:hypothetical protein